MVEVNSVRSKPFILCRSFHQGCPLFSLFYALALEPFLCRLKVTLVLGGITWPDTYHLGQICCLCWHLHACNKQYWIQSWLRYETVTRFKINCDKSPYCWLAVGFLEKLSSPRPIELNWQALQDTWHLIWAWSSSGEELVGIFGKD